LFSFRYEWLCWQQNGSHKGKSDIDLTKKSIVLLSVRISNQYKPSRQLKLLSVVICPQSETNCKHDLPSNPGSPYKLIKKKKIISMNIY